MYAVTLSDGTAITRLHLNGSVFETTQTITREDIEGKLRHVRIVRTEPYEDTDMEGLAGEYESMKLGYFMKHGEVTQILLLPRDEAEAEKLQLRGDIDYLAMMTGVEL